MGYNLYITKKDNYLDETGTEISKEEWLEYVSTDPELIIDKKSPDYVVLKDSEETYWLYWNDHGSIDSKNPSHSFIEKMVSISEALNAKVQGDDGEIYSSIPEGYKYISTHEPPNTFEYHRKLTDGKFEYIGIDATEKKIKKVEVIEVNEPINKTEIPENTSSFFTITHLVGALFVALIFIYIKFINKG